MNTKKIILKIIGWKFNIIGMFSPETALHQALTLFSKPKNGRIFSYQKKFLDSFKKTSIDAKGCKIQTYEKGNGKIKILLAHGWESNSWRWRKFIQFMGIENYTFIALDAPGHGLSQPDQFDLLLYSEAINTTVLKFKPDFIIGHSIGGLAVLLSCAEYDIPAQTKIISMGAPHSLGSIFERYFNAIGLSKKISSKIEFIFQKKYNRVLAQFSIQGMGSSIKNFGLILHDINDMTNEIINAEIISKSWANGHLISTEISNHSMQKEEIYKIIEDYVKT
jgi:esterase/lipase